MRVLALTLCTVFVMSAATAVAQDEFDDDELGGSEPMTAVTPSPEATATTREDVTGSRPETALLGEGEEPQRDENGEWIRQTRSGPEEERWQRRFALSSTLLGSTGAFFVPDAGTGAVDSFRIQFNLESFINDGWIFDDDGASRVGGGLSLSFTPHERVEIFASVNAWASRNLRVFPNLFLTLADTTIGAKVAFPISDAFTVGGQLELLVPTAAGVFAGFSGITPTARVLATVDLRERSDPLPLIVRGALGYRLDNTANLIEEDEQLRYDALADPRPPEDETRHLANAAERYGLAINRTDFLEIGLAIEAPIEATPKLRVHPSLEWRWGIPVNRQGYDCAFVPSEPGGDEPAERDDDCLARVGPSAFPMTITLGLRVFPVVRGLSVFGAVDIGVTGRSRGSFVRELAPTPPWRLAFGLSYTHDTRPLLPPPSMTREVPVEVEIETPPPVEGRVVGRVVKTGTEEPVPFAIVSFPGRADTAIATDGNGRFTSYLFPAGVIDMGLRASAHRPDGCQAEIPIEGGDVEVTCELEPTLVEVEEEEVRIHEQIRFGHDRAAILEESFPLMDEIVRAFDEHPELVEVEVQGHTDDTGTPDYNEDLSQRRANSVVRYLVEHGVAAERLSPRGYGQSRPLAPNTTDENRAKNRRVQFVITRRAEAEARATEAAP